MVNYQQKYIKYREKYLNLKNNNNLYGGDDDIYKFRNMAGDIIYITDINLTIEDIKREIATQKGYPYWFLITILDDINLLTNDTILRTIDNKELTFLVNRFTSDIYQNNINSYHGDIELLDKLNGDSYTSLRNINISQKLKDCKEFILFLINKYKNTPDFRTIIPFINDKTLLLSIIKLDRTIVSSISKELRADKEVMLAAVRQKGDALQYASTALRADREVVSAAVRQDGWALTFAPDELKDDKEIVIAAFINSGFIKPISNEKKAKIEVRDLILHAVKQDINAIYYASTRLKADKEIMLFVIKKWGLYLEKASPNIRADREVVLAAVRQNGKALQFASDALTADKEIVLEAIKEHSYIISYASERLKANKEFILSAVKINGETLQFIPYAFRRDREVALAAITENGNALRHVDSVLINDKYFLLEAIRRNKNALKYVPRELVNEMR
jgi:hypothetical protein